MDIANTVEAKSSPLKITIVGAGIGGLAAAIGLRRNGHDVQVFEKGYMQLPDQTGAALHLCPNANGILRHWGVHAEKFGGSLMSRYVELSQDGTTLKDLDLTESNKRWPHPWHLVQREALHQELKRIATSLEGPGKPVTILRGEPVDGLDPARGTITLRTGGPEVKGDVIIGADGIRSTTRKFIKNVEPFPTGKAAYRFVIERSKAEEDETTAPLVCQMDTLILWFGQDTRMVMYPCKNNELLNYVGIHPAAKSEMNSHNNRTAWNNSATVKQVLETYKDFDPRLKALVGKLDVANHAYALKVWQLMDMETLPTWTSGRLALLGDAAHPFLPYQAQGAAQAIEDAAALSIVLPQGTPPDEVPERLKLYESIRAERAHRIQDYSRKTGQDWVDGKPVVDMRAFEEYNFNHDELAHSAAALKQWEMSRKPLA
ncbi:hypothetical protein VTI74DRAFT_10539 [Chaetomium olivicolor]